MEHVMFMYVDWTSVLEIWLPFPSRVGKDTEISAPAEHQQANGIDNVVHSSTFEVDDSSILPSGNKCK